MTLIDVSAVLAILSQYVAVGTFTVERSDSVSAPSVAAEEGHNSALVDIRAIVIRAKLESLVADALVRAKRVHAGAVVANIWISLTLVDIHAVVPVPSEGEATVADTLETTLQIVAGAIVANPWSLVAFVDVDAVSLAQPQFVSCRANAFEVTLLVYALCISTARIWNL